VSDILENRARALARPAVAPGTAGGTIDIIRFVRSAQHYAFEVAWVAEVQPLKSLAPLPGVPGFVLGIVNVRGRIISLVDLRIFAGLPEQAPSPDPRVIVLRGPGMEMGILADEIIGNEQLAVDALQQSPPAGRGEIEIRLARAADGLVILDAASLLAENGPVVGPVR
jgi:purine-binding chemotaxis protein CheW